MDINLNIPRSCFSVNMPAVSNAVFLPSDPTSILKKVLRHEINTLSFSDFSFYSK